MIEWRQNLNRVYKKISPQKMSPSHSSETQTIISLQNLLLSQTKIAFGNSNVAMDRLLYILVAYSQTFVTRPKKRKSWQNLVSTINKIL